MPPRFMDLRETECSPQGVKSERKTAELCATFTGEQFSGLNPKDGKINMLMKTFKERVRAHCIETGMWDIFNLSDSKMLPNKKWDLFCFHAMLPLPQVLQAGSHSPPQL
jgi:hypothetical protein